MPLARIEPITAENRDDVMTIAREFHAESRYCNEEFDDEHIGEYLDVNYFADTYHPPCHGFLAYDEEDTPIGFMSFALVNKLMNSAVIALEEVMYVSPTHRGTRVGAELNKCCEDRAKAFGCSAFIVMANSGIATAETFDRLEGYDYNRIGVMFAKEF